MGRTFGTALVVAVCLGGSVGCGAPAPVGVSGPIPEQWVDGIITHIVQWVEEGTGIDIERGDVKIESLAARKESSGAAHISDFKITVNYRKTAFTSSPKDVPCSAD